VNAPLQGSRNARKTKPMLSIIGKIFSFVLAAVVGATAGVGTD
jgi:hypothetical protein